MVQTRSATKPSTEEDCLVCPGIKAAGTLPKRLIVCCDGTFCASNLGIENNAGNIARISRVIANVGLTAEGEKIPQIVYYQSGVGTGWLSAATRGWQGAFGDGLNEKVCEGYNFLANNYGPGDEIFLFGFSRGAYTARSLAGFLCQVGLLTPGMMDYFDEIFEAYKTRGADESFEDTAWAKAAAEPGELGLDTGDKSGKSRMAHIRQWAHLHIKIKVVGVFDTVGSLGMSGWVDQPGQDVRFYSTKLNPKIENAFHALALDESRGNFPPTLWYLDQACKDANVNLKQCWFPGYHGDIGGHNDWKGETNSVDELTFAWMCDQLDGLLQLSQNAMQHPILNRIEKGVVITAATPPPKSPEEVFERRITWSDGTLKETNTWNSIWWIASSVATRRGSYVREPGVYHAVADGQVVDPKDFREDIHPSVWHRMSQKELGYKPQRLSDKAWSRVKASDGGFQWVRTVKGEEEVRLREYVIPKLVERDTQKMWHWTGSLERKIAPPEYLKELDEANGL